MKLRGNCCFLIEWRSGHFFLINITFYILKGLNLCLLFDKIIYINIKILSVVCYLIHESNYLSIVLFLVTCESINLSL